MEEFVTVKLPRELVGKFKEHMDVAGFSSVENYLITTLRQALFELENKKEDYQKIYNEKGEKEVKDRLRNIRYLD